MKNSQFLQVAKTLEGKKVKATLHAHNASTNASFIMPEISGVLKTNPGGSVSFVQIGKINSLTKEGKPSNKGSRSLTNREILEISE